MGEIRNKDGLTEEEFLKQYKPSKYERPSVTVDMLILCMSRYLDNLKVEIKFTAKTTSASPLTENSATIKSVKESASQLGLDFEVEE